MATNGTTGLHRKIAESEQKVNRLRFELAVERAVLARLRTIAHGESPALFPSTTTHTRRPKIVKGSIAQSIVDILHDNKNRPMRVRDITDSLKGRGVKTTSTKGLMPMVISAMRRRTDIFQRLRRGVYRLVDFTADAPPIAPPEAPGDTSS